MGRGGAEEGWGVEDLLSVRPSAVSNPLLIGVCILWDDTNKII